MSGKTKTPKTINLVFTLTIQIDNLESLINTKTIQAKLLTLIFINLNLSPTKKCVLNGIKPSWKFKSKLNQIVCEINEFD